MIGEAVFQRWKIKGFTVVSRGCFANFRALRLFINFGQIVTGTGFRCGFDAGGFQTGFSAAKAIENLFTGESHVIGEIIEQLKTEPRILANFFFEKTFEELLKMTMILLQDAFLNKQQYEQSTQCRNQGKNPRERQIKERDHRTVIRRCISQKPVIIDRAGDWPRTFNRRCSGTEHFNARAFLWGQFLHHLNLAKIARDRRAECVQPVAAITHEQYTLRFACGRYRAGPEKALLAVNINRFQLHVIATQSAVDQILDGEAELSLQVLRL